MNFLATPLRRKVLFACLYLSEGAPIGFIWLALPTRLREAGAPIEQITALAAILVLPWTFKFVWAPLIDVLQWPRWTLVHWIVAAQCVMGAALVPLLWLDLRDDLSTISRLLLVHAFAAATQDVSIDALCISVTDVKERGRLNGWMQAGMLLGRALMGGGALILADYVGLQPVVLLLILLTTFSMALVTLSRPPADVSQAAESVGQRARGMLAALRAAALRRNTWLGLFLALVGGAAFKSLEVVYGPFLVDRGYDEVTIGWFSAGPMILSMIAGALVGGWLADRWSPQRFVPAALVFFVVAIAALAISDWALQARPGAHLFVFLTTTAFGIGLFTSSSYALFMQITFPSIAASQFSAFMGATNGCESWSTYAIGVLIAAGGYPVGMLAMCAASLCALPLVWNIRPPLVLPPLGRRSAGSAAN